LTPRRFVIFQISRCQGASLEIEDFAPLPWTRTAQMVLLGREGFIARSGAAVTALARPAESYKPII